VQKVAQRWLRRTTPIPSSVISRADLRTLFSRLQEKVNESIERQIGHLACPPSMALANWEELKQQARDAANLTALVIGSAGEQVVTTEEAGLLDQHLPDRITSITFDAGLALKNSLNVDLENRFVLKLDFSDPPGFHEYDPQSRPTPNDSSLEVAGPEETWVSGVHDLILQFFQNRSTPREWLHSSWVFMAVHWLVVLPASIWLTYRLVNVLPDELTNAHPVFTAGLYIYFFYLAFVVLRVIKLVGRLAWPYIELEGASRGTARVVISTVAAGLIVPLIYDVITAVFL
jgi:hypothetical protein